MISLVLVACLGAQCQPVAEVRWGQGGFGQAAAACAAQAAALAEVNPGIRFRCVEERRA